MGESAGWRKRVRGFVGLPRDVVILTAISFVVAIGFGVVVPVLPVFARSFHVGTFAVGAVVSGFAVMRFVTSPFCARMIAWAGERVVLSSGVGIVAVSSALMAYSANYAQLLALRSIGGVGSAMFTVSALTRLLGVTPPHLRGRAAALYQGGFLIGGMAGPALGGLLLEISMRAPFLFYAATLAAAGAIGMLLLRRRSPTPRDPGAASEPTTGKVATTDTTDAPNTQGTAAVAPATAPRSIGQLVRDARYQAACLASLAQGWSMFGVRNALVPLIVTETLALQPRWTGIAFALAAIPQALLLGPSGSFTDRRGRRPALIVAGVSAALLTMAVPLSPNIGVLIAVLCCYALPAALMSTAPAALVGDVAGGRGGKAVAVFSMCSDAGAILGPLVAGWLVDALSFEAAFGTGAVLFALAAAWAIALPGDRAAKAA